MSDLSWWRIWKIEIWFLRAEIINYFKWKISNSIISRIYAWKLKAERLKKSWNWKNERAKFPRDQKFERAKSTRNWIFKKRKRLAVKELWGANQGN